MPFHSNAAPGKLPRPAWTPYITPQRTGPDNRRLQIFELEGLARIYWPEAIVDQVVNVTLCESGGWTGAWAPPGEDSRGLLQLDLDYHPELARWNLFDPQINYYFAYHLWSAQGWRPWSCARELGYV